MPKFIADLAAKIDTQSRPNPDHVLIASIVAAFAHWGAERGLSHLPPSQRQPYRFLVIAAHYVTLTVLTRQAKAAAKLEAVDGDVPPGGDRWAQAAARGGRAYSRQRQLIRAGMS